MKEIDLSVIIPVYNTEKYIKRCIDSVITAVKKVNIKSEILIINDGSTDNSETIIKEYLNEYAELIKYYKKENAGLADTKNVGIKMANGKYLSFIDSDDYIDENFYLDSFKIIEKEKADMVICDWETICEDNNTTYIVEAKNGLYEDDFWGCIDVFIMPSSCNKIVKKELFNNLEFPKGLIYEDLATTLILFCRANKIKYINKPYYKYYLSKSSIMRSTFSEKNLQMIDIFDILFSRISLESKLSQDEKNKMLCMVYTRRFYESILEPIANLKLNDRIRFFKIIKRKIKRVNKVIKKNEYFLYEINSCGKLKYFFNNLLLFFIDKELSFFIALICRKNSYYKLFHIKYVSEVYFNKKEDRLHE